MPPEGKQPMKKAFLPLALACALCLTACAPARSEVPKIGVCIYNAADTFMSSVVRQIEKEAAGSAEVIDDDARR